MPQSVIRINQIFGGISPSSYFGPEGSYLSSIAIDPDMPVTDSGTGSIRTSGQIRPVGYATFDGAPVDGNPLFIVTNPKNTLIYVVLANGTFISYSSSLGSETEVGTVTGTVANGAVYYNNYLYIFTGTDVSRYGPLDGTPALTNTVWTGSTLGSQSALINSTYPSIRGSGTYPNHVAHVHLDNKLYFCDYNNSTYPGQGIIHYIKTKKTTDEGDTNDNSTANALDLPFGFRPIALASYGEDLVIAAIQSTDTTTDQGNAALFFWDTVSSSFYKQVYLDEPIISALKVVNGILYIFAGKLAATNTAGNGYSVYQYLGGQSFKEIFTAEEGWPPLAGAVDANGDRLVWGSCMTNPTNAAAVWAYGSKDGRLPSAVHCIARSTASASATDGLVTSLAYVLQASNARPRLVIGARDATNFHLEQISTTYQTSIWRSQLFNIGQAFRVTKIVLNFAQAIAANMTLVPTLYVDSESSSYAGTTINSTNYTGSPRKIVLTSDNFGRPTAQNDFYLELSFQGTALLTCVLPITIWIETIEDSTT